MYWLYANGGRVSKGDDYMAIEKHCLQFFQVLMSPKATFPCSKNIFSKESFISTSGNLYSELLFGAFVSDAGRLLKLEEPVLEGKHFPASGNHFL